MSEAEEAAKRLLEPMIYDGIKYLYDKDIQIVAAAFLALLSKLREQTKPPEPRP